MENLQDLQWSHPWHGQWPHSRGNFRVTDANGFDVPLPPKTFDISWIQYMPYDIAAAFQDRSLPFSNLR